jgi:hypothetical protein
MTHCHQQQQQQDPEKVSWPVYFWICCWCQSRGLCCTLQRVLTVMLCSNTALLS